jgi:hypothetical protein
MRIIRPASLPVATAPSPADLPVVQSSKVKLVIYHRAPDFMSMQRKRHGPETTERPVSQALSLEYTAKQKSSSRSERRRRLLRHRWRPGT